ncbi:MAG: ribonuclease P protein component [Wenzhouxiangellaceae bacterium]|nr:ribonuclease P protein component [Wenzhouxiangellaceae bacterium]
MTAQSFPRSARLLDGRAFRQVFDARQVQQDRYFRIHHAPSDQARLGLAISRRTARRAVDRNRLKRLVRESFRQHRSSLRALDFVVLARMDAPKTPGPELLRSLTQLWQRFTPS